MATIPIQSNHTKPFSGINCWKWLNLTTTDNVGEPILLSRMTERTVQVVGTFGASANLVIEGSNDGVNYFTLNNFNSTALSFLEAGLERVSENCSYIRPRLASGGDGGTSLNVYIACIGEAG